MCAILIEEREGGKFAELEIHEKEKKVEHVTN